MKRSNDRPVFPEIVGMCRLKDGVYLWARGGAGEVLD